MTGFRKAQQYYERLMAKDVAPEATKISSNKASTRSTPGNSSSKQKAALFNRRRQKELQNAREYFKVLENKGAVTSDERAPDTSAGLCADSIMAVTGVHNLKKNDIPAVELNLSHKDGTKTIYSVLWGPTKRFVKDGCLGFTCLSCLLATMVFFLVAHSLPSDNVAVHSDQPERFRSPPCFASSSPVNDGGLAPHCKGHVFLTPCPSVGLCHGGILEKCDSSIFEITKKRDACVLTLAAETKIASTISLLESWSITHECHPGAAPFYEKDDEEYGRPLFIYDQFAEELIVGLDLELVQAANDREPTFLVQRSDNNILIGLHPTQEIASPFLCQVKKALFESHVTALLLTLWESGCWLCLNVSWNVLNSICVVAFVLFCTIVGLSSAQQCYHKWKNAKDRALIEVQEMQQRAYTELTSNVAVGLSSIALRDVVLSSYSNLDKGKQKHLATKIWPVVMMNIRSDYRVAKMFMRIEGEVREVWQWMDVPTNTRRTPLRFVAVTE